MQKTFVLFLILFSFGFKLSAQRKILNHHISPKVGLVYNGEFLLAELDYIIDFNIAKKWRISTEVGFFNRYWLAQRSVRKNPSFYGTGGGLQVGHSYKKQRELFLRMGYFYFDLDYNVYSLGIGHCLTLPQSKSKIQLVSGVDFSRDLDIPSFTYPDIITKRYFSLTLAYVQQLAPIFSRK